MSEANISKNVKLSIEFDQYLVNHPKQLSKIPNGAYIIITVNGDNSFNKESISLIKEHPRKKFIEAHKTSKNWLVRPFEKQPA